MTERKHSHYYKDVKKFHFIDVYRVLSLFNVIDPCLQHAVKKLLVAGGRGSKDISKDIQEAIDTLERWKEMQAEDIASVFSFEGGFSVVESQLTPEHRANIAHNVSKVVHNVNNALTPKEPLKGLEVRV